MFKLTRSALKAYENGRKARKQELSLEDNPNKHGPNQVLASWWEKGWLDEKRERLEKINEKLKTLG